MRKLLRSLPALLSLLLVWTPLSVSTCDLSCWLRQTFSDCHSDAAVTELSQSAAPSMIDMDSQMESMTHTHGNHLSAHRNMNAGGHHSMFLHVATIHISPQVQNSAATSSGIFDQSRTPSPCAHEACSQTSLSASPPRITAAPHAYPSWRPICISILANFSAHFDSPLSPGASPPISLAADLRTALRI